MTRRTSKHYNDVIQYLDLFDQQSLFLTDMAKKVPLSQIKELQEQTHHPGQNKSLASSSVRQVGVSTHQLINPRNRAHFTTNLPPHQYTRTNHPIRDQSQHPLPPHQFTKSRLQEQGQIQKKPESYVQWIPYERKIVDFKDETRVEKKPVKKIVQDFRQQLRYDEVPRERTGLDYYAVQRIKKYIPVEYDQRQTVMVEKMVPFKKTIYVPRMRQVYHGPNPQELPIYGQELNLNPLQIQHTALPQTQAGASMDINHFNQSSNLSRPFSKPENHVYPNQTSIPQFRPQPQFQPQPQTLPLRTPSPQQLSYQTLNIMRKHKNTQLYSSDEYQAYVPSFRY